MSSYIKQSWVNGPFGGTPLSAERLEHIEDGIETHSHVLAPASTGATAATKYVGGTTSGAPITGTFAVGDFVIDQTGSMWVCTVAGTPGTWVQSALASTTVGGSVARVKEGPLSLLDPRVNAALDGVTDDSAAWATAIALLPSTGGEIYHPGGISQLVSASIPLNKNGIKIRGANKLASLIRSNTVDLFASTGNRGHLVFESLGLTSQAGGGHIWAPPGVDLTGISSSRWHDLNIICQSATKVAYYQPAGLFLDNLLTNIAMATSHTSLPAWYVVSAEGGCNTNTFYRWRATCPFYSFHLEQSAAGSFANDNTFRDINFEIPNGGCIRLRSCANTLIEQCVVYDLVSATTQHLFLVDKSAAGAASRYTTLRQVQRRGGTLGSGLADIRLTSGSLTLISQCDTSALSGFVIDANFQSSLTVIGANSGVTITNGLGDEVQIYASTVKIGGNKVLGTRGTAVADASGGTIVDVEARAALNALLARLRAATGHGLIA